MVIKLYNTISRKIEPFVPIDGKEVKIYVCGITPYDASHLGHAFVFTVFDTLVRFLTFCGYKVTYVQNITDVDDDMLKKARELGENWQKLGDRVVGELLDDFVFLNIQKPTNMPKASAVIEKIIEIDKVLVDKGLAYEKDGNVYFDTKKYQTYGSFSRLSYDRMVKISNIRGNNIKDPNKKDPLDFILWQRSLPDEPRWDSPWGTGRPGWHIECSAMSMQYLNEQIDIHGGGSDLIFPHHESEIAQSETFTGKKPFVKYWLHCGMVLYESEKMSKSLGNLIFIKDLKKKYSANAIRWYLLSNHYRRPWEYIEEDLTAAQKIVDTIEKKAGGATGGGPMKRATKVSISWDEGAAESAFFNALATDFNTPLALEILQKEADVKTQQHMWQVLGFI